MLVLVGDWHLTDGSIGETLSPEAVELFAERLQHMAIAASHRADGTYRPIERLDLVLLGDILDPLRSTRWIGRPNVRPWGNPHAPDFVDQIARITTDILEHNADTLAALRALTEPTGIMLPPALKAARPATDGELQPVSVRVHYAVGNHDWFYHLPGPNYDALRQAIVRNMGLAQRSERPLPHETSENEELLQVLRRHKVAARHGDVFDPLSFEGDRDTSSLSDAIVIDVLARFAAEVQSQLVDELPAATLLGLQEVEHVRPLLLAAVWIDGLLDRTCPWPALRKKVKSVWDRIVDEFLSLEFVRRHDALCPVNVVDGLERALKFSKRLSTGWSAAVTQWFCELRGASTSSYVSHALAEPDFRNRRAKYIVYGHTHEAEWAPLDASYADSYVLEQVYFNAGTWRRVHRPTQIASQQQEFIASESMSFLAFFQGDERRGRPYETWTGTLGRMPSEAMIHRIDQGRSHTAHPAFPSAAVPRHAPHFTSLSKSTTGPGRRVG